MSGKRITGKASTYQKGEAAEIRNGGGSQSASDRTALNQIVHSGDTSGPWAKTPNPYRDPTNSFDPEAEKVLERNRK